MKYYVISGEASGDLHGARLIREIGKLDPDACFRCWGGEKMQEAGGTVVKHYRDLAYMGFLEVLMNIRTIMGNMEFCKEDILAWKPDAVILIDYPGFNMRMAKFLHGKGFRVIYYIAPQMWAWKQKRVHKVHRDTDLTFVVLPFEKDFHAKFGYNAEFVGHPLLDSINEFQPDPSFRTGNNLGDKPLIALVPGSRKQEISRILPLMLSVVDEFMGYQFVIAGVNSLDDKFYRKFINGKPVKIIKGKTYDLIKTSEAALVASGTATLETALLGTPQIVCYKMNLVTAVLAWMVLKVKHISLVNLVLDKRAIAELVQFQLNKSNLTSELHLILDSEENRNRIKADYDEMRHRLGLQGASSKAAAIIVDKLNSKVQ